MYAGGSGAEAPIGGKLRLWTASVMLMVVVGACRSGEVDSPVVASFERRTLTLNELRTHLPPNLKERDSIDFARHYIQEWKLEQVLMNYGEAEIDDLEEHIRYRLADARRKIIVDEVRDHITQEHLDVTLNQDQYEQFYKANITNYLANEFIFSYYYIKTASTANANLKNQILTRDNAEREQLAEWCKQNAVVYKLDADYMGPPALNAIAREVRADLSVLTPESGVQVYGSQEEQTMYYHIFYMADVVRPGRYIPLAAVRDEIKETLLAKRRNDVLRDFEARLFEKARAASDFDRSVTTP